MHDIRAIRENPDLYDAAWARRGLAPLAKKIVEFDTKLRAASTAKQEAEAARNAASKAIGAAKAKKDEGEASRLIEQVAALKQRTMTTPDQLTIRRKCVEDFRDDFALRDFCEKRQLEALATLSR